MKDIDKRSHERNVKCKEFIIARRYRGENPEYLKIYYSEVPLVSRLLF